MNKLRTAVPAIGVYLGTALLSVAIVAWVIQLWNADFSVPFHWKLGDDVSFQATLVKNLGENGRLYTNAFLGAPGQMDLHDFPQPYFLHFFFLKLLSLFSRDFVLVLNLYFLLAFPLTAVVSLFVFRCFKFSWASGVLGSLLFTFLPYHFMRGEAHFFLSTYYLVPLMVLVSLWISTGESLFPFDRAAGKRGLVTYKGVISLLSCALITFDNPYYAFFGAFFLVVAAAAGTLRYGHTGAIRSAGILLAALLLTFSLSLAPNAMYVRKHGNNPRVAHRQQSESEYFGLKIAQLILPVTGHRVHRVAERKDDYNRGGVWINENDSASLGLIGSCGFLALLGWLIFGRRGENAVSWLDPLSVLNISAVLLGTIGGFSSLFALEISPVIRSYNRISIYIGFLAMFAVVALLERLRQAWASQTWARPTRDGVLFGLLAASLLVLGILDQTTAGFVPRYPEIRAEYESDADFVGRLEASLPPGAMVFQLPYVPFPESRPVNRMRDYEHLRGYLHSKNLRWSYGTIKGREGDLWEQSVAAEPIKEMVETLVSAGFSGIYVDRFGYADQGAKLESELATALGTTLVVSANQRLSFFTFAKEKAKPH